MSFIQQDNIITIDNRVVLTVEQFKILEPEFNGLPAGYTTRIYKPGDVNCISGPNRTTIQECVWWKDGDRYISRIPEFLRLKESEDKKNEEIYGAVQRELKKRLPYAENRQSEYPKVDELIVAMWESFVEGRPEADHKVEILQKKRLEVKAKYPKK